MALTRSESITLVIFLLALTLNLILLDKDLLRLLGMSGLGRNDYRTDFLGPTHSDRLH